MGCVLRGGLDPLLSQMCRMLGSEHEVFEILYFRFIRESMGLSKTRAARQFLKLPLFLMTV